MMGVNPLELPYLLVPSNYMEQSDLGTQGPYPCRCGGRCQVCVAWERRVRRVPREAPLPLAEARDQPTDNRQPGQGRKPFRLLEPHGSDRRGSRNPTPSRLYSGIGVLLGLEKVGSAIHRSGHGRGPPPPSLGLFWVGERLSDHSQASACLQRGRGTRGGPPAPSPSRAAGVGDAPRASRRRPPRVWTATATARLVVRIRRQGRDGIRVTGTPAGVPPLDGVGAGFRCLRLGAGSRRRVLLGPWAGMPHAQASGLLRHPPSTGRDLDGAAPAVALPLAARCGLGTPRLCHAEGQSCLRRAPRCQGWAPRTGAWHKGHHAQARCPPQASRPAPRRLASRSDPVAALQAQRAALLHRHRRLPTVTRFPIPPPQSQRQPAIATHAETQEPLVAVVPSGFALPVGGPQRPWCLGGGWRGPRECQRGGVLREPRGRDGIDLQRLARDGALHRGKMGGTQGLEEVPATVLMERGPGDPCRQPLPYAALFQPLPHRGPRMIAIAKRQDQGSDSTPSRAHMCRVGRDETLDDGRDLQTSSDTQDQWHLCHGTHLRHGQGPEAPPVVAALRQHQSGMLAATIGGSPPKQTSCGLT